MRLLLSAAASIMLAAAVVSCAKDENVDSSSLEQMSLDAWVAKHINRTDTVAFRQDNGMYVQFLQSETVDSLVPADTVVWVRLNYTGYTMDNDVYITRYKDIARQQGTYTPYTYYSPDYLYCGSKNSNMIEGQYYAIKRELAGPDGSKVKLAQGSKVRLYMPSKVAFGSHGTSDEQGYGGQYSLSGNKPVIEDLEIVEVVKNPVAREEKLVKEYAVQKWNMEENDTIKPFLYLDVLTADTTGGRITVDSTVNIYYVAKFLDGFIFDTNIDSVQVRLYGEAKSNSAFKYKPKDDENDYISAFYYAIPRLYYGQRARMVFTSAYGYGITGKTAASDALNEYYSNYLSLLFNNSLYNSSYSDLYYANYMNTLYYANSLNQSTDDEQTVTTEIQSYTPLIFELYIQENK